ncbi:hypothetical protein E1193_13375 [Micromonospora sp. KC606]|uniref:hypothetical protein n=1 Tax=Micromonospora sp. KC606 TaxID=2530379 RepID=UPI001049DC0B|nr:hypothetical protein [Micromonospora sp. KC606]TDC81889.1 hypothetical protein E1193_13375 [Micromonospora sp. KC606]
MDEQKMSQVLGLGARLALLAIDGDREGFFALLGEGDEARRGAGSLVSLLRVLIEDQAALRAALAELAISFDLSDIERQLGEP